MFGAWIAGSFALWLATGYAVWRFGAASISRFRAPRPARAALAAIVLFGSAGLLLASLQLLSRSAPGDGPLGAQQMAALTAVGAAFVACQVAAALFLLPLAVTNRTPPPSIIENPEGTDS